MRDKQCGACQSETFQDIQISHHVPLDYYKTPLPTHPDYTTIDIMNPLKSIPPTKMRFFFSSGIW